MKPFDVSVGSIAHGERENGRLKVGTYLAIDPLEMLILARSESAIRDEKILFICNCIDLGFTTGGVLTCEYLITPEVRTIFESGRRPAFDALTMASFSRYAA